MRGTDSKGVTVDSLSRSTGQPLCIGLRWCVPIMAVSLIGCATVNESRYPMKDGWRAARIDEIGSAADLRQITSEDCRTVASPTQREANRFATVSYWRTVASRRYPSGWFPRVVPVAEASTLRAGDLVYVNILDCAAPVIARNDPR